MSDAESRILSWPGPPGPPVPPPRPPWGGWPRPPSGAWPPGALPPGPGPFPQPPDVFSAFAWLAKNYQESQAAKAFLKLLITDLIAEDPDFLANAQAIVGVTDGSDVQPGQVGEWQNLEQQLSVPVTMNTQMTAMGVLPAGDWDCWASANFSVFITAAVIQLSPIPAGFSHAMVASAASVGSQEGVTLQTPIVRALTRQPTLIAFEVQTNTMGSGSAAGVMDLDFSARRRR